jgi:transketolase
MIGVAAGCALAGKIPFAVSFAVFSTGQTYNVIRQTVCYGNFNVKIVGTHAGLQVGEDGATHQALEDIGLMRCLPFMRVFQPADAIETKQIVRAMIETDGPMYLRLLRSGVPTVHDSSFKFTIGKSDVLRDGSDISLFATGALVSPALEAAKRLEKEGIKARVVNVASLKPFDEATLIESAEKTKLIVTLEDHSIYGGLGSIVAEALSEHRPTPLHRIGMTGFGESGKSADLYAKYRFDAEGVYERVKEILKR